MSTQPENEGDGEPQPPPGSHLVGYGRPPKEHRFKKGRSGNPLGRPCKPKQSKTLNNLSFAGQPANQILLQEAYRPVVLREGERTIELPAIQAVFRAMGVAAMKGNRFAQRTIAELVQGIESEDRKLREDYLKAAIDYKYDWDRAIDRARKSGEAVPQPIPHPDDICINFQTGQARVCGPMTKEDKADWDKLVHHLDDLQMEVSTYAAMFRKSRSETKKAHALEIWQFAQKLFDQLNDNLPKRYRKSLEDRCSEEGASRAGQQSRRLWPE